jgi:dephospho-CoA kinase
LIIVAITGMPGAGKSTAAAALEKIGWYKIAMGDVIREETEKRGLVPNEANTGSVMMELRQIHGEDAVARIVIEKALKSGKDKIVIDGVRSIKEVELFRKYGNVLLIAVQASPERRFNLLRERGRMDDPKVREDFERRDKREISVGIGDAIALADECISNERLTKDELMEKVSKCVIDWMREK